MNSKLNSNPFRAAIGSGLLVLSLAAASAGTVVTFNVDMSNAPFDPNSQTVSVHGTFDGWGPGFVLTNNPTGPSPSIWSGTTNVPTNASVMSYKYVIDPGGTYETVYLAGGHNRLITLPATSGASLTLPLVFFSDTTPNPVTNQVTFQVNMAQQINTGAFDPLVSTVEARGLYMGWANTIAQTNDPTILVTNQFGLVTSNVYVYTYEIIGSPGQTMDYKYHIDNGVPLDNWESPAPNTGDPADNNNRFFNLGTGPSQALPIVYFNDSPYAPVATNAVTFQVDMSSQVLLGNFDPSTGIVEVRGDFNSWGNSQILCTNDPSAPNTNLYKTVVSIHDGVGATHQYKFWSSVTANGGWETMANNRTLQIVQGDTLILPVVYFSDFYVDPADVLPAATLVTFQVSMTNAVGTDAHVFDPNADVVYINGVPTFAAWSGALPALTNNPVPSVIYSIDLLLPKGSYVQQTYKYGINAADDEAPAGTNHVRYVRATGTYVMPLDVFGHAVVEPSFGNLKVAPPSGGHVLISWLGRPGVHLQSRSSIAGGSWLDHLETDGLNATNWPISGTSQFFRLIKK